MPHRDATSFVLYMPCTKYSNINTDIVVHCFISYIWVYFNQNSASVPRYQVHILGSCAEEVFDGAYLT